MERKADGPQTGLYRSRHGVFFGVCRGLAQRFDVSVLWLRVLLVALVIVTGFWPALMIYIIAAMVMKKEPVVSFGSDADQEFYESYATSRSLALKRVQRTYERLNRRIQRIEARVTAKEFDWDRRLRES